MGIKKNNGLKFWEVREGIIGKFLNILDASLVPSQYQLRSNYIHHSLNLKYYTVPPYGGLT